MTAPCLTETRRGINTTLYMHKCRPIPKRVSAFLLLLLGCIFWDTRTSCCIALSAWLLRSAVLLARQPEENEGHRAGGKGFNSDSSLFIESVCSHQCVAATAIPAWREACASLHVSVMRAASIAVANDTDCCKYLG